MKARKESGWQTTTYSNNTVGISGPLMDKNRMGGLLSSCIENHRPGVLSTSISHRSWRRRGGVPWCCRGHASSSAIRMHGPSKLHFSTVKSKSSNIHQINTSGNKRITDYIKWWEESGWRAGTTANRDVHPLKTFMGLILPLVDGNQRLWTTWSPLYVDNFTSQMFRKDRVVIFSSIILFSLACRKELIVLPLRTFARPQSHPPASRTVVNPRINMSRSTTEARAATRLAGSTSRSCKLAETADTWTWASQRPGITYAPCTSIVCYIPPPTSTISQAVWSGRWTGWVSETTAWSSRLQKYYRSL